MRNGSAAGIVEEWGEATEEDIAELDAAMAALHAAETEKVAKREEAGRVMRRLMDERGAQRKTIAYRADVNDQTVTNMAYGRPEPKRKAKGKQ